jgi:hypothetical protein
MSKPDLRQWVYDLYCQLCHTASRSPLTQTEFEAHVVALIKHHKASGGEVNGRSLKAILIRCVEEDWRPLPE